MVICSLCPRVMWQTVTGFNDSITHATVVRTVACYGKHGSSTFRGSDASVLLAEKCETDELPDKKQFITDGGKRPPAAEVSVSSPRRRHPHCWRQTLPLRRRCCFAAESTEVPDVPAWLMGRPVSKSRFLQCKGRIRLLGASRVPVCSVANCEQLSITKSLFFLQFAPYDCQSGHTTTSLVSSTTPSQALA